MAGRSEPEPQQELVRLAAQAIKAAWEKGCPIASAAYETAPIAVRRRLSFRRRGLAVDRFEDWIKDLAKGLIERFERDPRFIGPLSFDYEYLAGRIAEALSTQGRPQSAWTPERTTLAPDPGSWR